MLNSFISPIDRTLNFAGSQSGPESNGNDRVLRIPQSFSITATSTLDCLMSYPGQSLVGSKPSA